LPAAQCSAISVISPDFRDFGGLIRAEFSALLRKPFRIGRFLTFSPNSPK
jgi:hypothetical protein